jgi:integrase
MVYRQAMRNGKVKSNPARLVAARVENNGRVRFLLEDEERALRKVMVEKYPIHIPAFDVAINSGMRRSEQFTLTWDCVDLRRKLISLDVTKNGSDRHIPINAACLAAFAVLAATPHRKADRVFMSMKGEPLNNPRKWFASAMQDAKINGLHWHDLRHTFCSRLAMAGVDIRTIAQLAGHKTLSMAMRYSHLAPSHNLAAIEKLTPVT